MNLENKIKILESQITGIKDKHEAVSAKNSSNLKSSYATSSEMALATPYNDYNDVKKHLTFESQLKKQQVATHVPQNGADVNRIQIVDQLESVLE